MNPDQRLGVSRYPEKTDDTASLHTCETHDPARESDVTLRMEENSDGQ